MIKSFDGQVVHNSYVDALVAQEIRRLNAERAAEEVEYRKKADERIRQLESELAMHKSKEARLYSKIIADAKRNHGIIRISVLAKIGWVIIGWTVLAMDGLRKFIRCR